MIILGGIKIDLKSSHRSKLSVLKAIPEACSHLPRFAGPHSPFLFFILCQLAKISSSLASWRRWNQNIVSENGRICHRPFLHAPTSKGSQIAPLAHRLTL